MTSLSSSQTVFNPSIDEPENNRINFRDSLKFFQEQLIINGASFPKPSPCRSGADTFRKNGSPLLKDFESDNRKTPKDSSVCQEDIQSVKCKIAIPTVDTILESVRVLRAIQKSQEERGSSWNLDIKAKSDVDLNFNYTDEWIEITHINQNDYCNKVNDETKFVTEEKCAAETTNATEIVEMKDEIKQLDESLEVSTQNSNTESETCPFWPSSTLNNNYSHSENSISEESAEANIKNIEFENLKTDCSSSEDPVTAECHRENDLSCIEKVDDSKISKVESNDSYQDNETEKFSELGNKNLSEIPLVHDTPDSLRSICTELLNHLNSNKDEKSTKDLSPESNIITELKIETFEHIVTQEQEDIVLNESQWKENPSATENIFIKIESADSDSGIGTQRSESSLSQNNTSLSLIQKDSWSDSCSSHYASAECSPYHSLNSLVETSLGFCTTLGETKENAEVFVSLKNYELEDTSKKAQDCTIDEAEGEECTFVPKQNDFDAEITDNHTKEISNEFSDSECNSEYAELDTEISYCNFITNYTIENPCIKTEKQPATEDLCTEICDSSNNVRTKLNDDDVTCIEKDPNSEEQKSLSISVGDTEFTNDEGEPDQIQKFVEKDPNSEKQQSLSISVGDTEFTNDDGEPDRIQKFTTTSCDLVSIVESLYTIKENPAFQILPTTNSEEEKFEEQFFVLSKGIFHDHPEGNYLIKIEDSVLHITKDSQFLCSLNMKYGEVSLETSTTLKIDNRMGRCVYVQCGEVDLMLMKEKIERYCLKHWQTDCLQLVHYPLKCHQNVVIIDLGSCSTRAGILMDQPTLPSLFFPTICATDKRTGKSVYGMEALQSEVRQHSNLSFPVRPTNKITKHTIDIGLLEGLFQKIFSDLKIDPTEYTVQLSLPRNLSINAQIELMKLLLENLTVKAVSFTNQALLTLYAHDVSTAVVVDIGDRTDVLPVVDGFIVENGVTKLPHGGQRLIHHMKHGLAEKRISLSNDIDSFVVQYIIENLAYIAEDYDKEMEISLLNPDLVRKTISLQPASSKASSKTVTLEDARFTIPEGLFNPDLWGLDSPGIHHLVQKAIQATSVDARKQIAENIYVSGGVTMLPGFVERLSKEVAKLSKTKIVPKVYGSSYRYHCTYIGACKFAKMEVFPQVCVNLQEFSKNSASALKKCALYL